MGNVSEADLKWLRVGAGRSGRVGLAMMAIAPLLYLGLVWFHLWMALLWAHSDGLTFGQAWHGWLGGIHAGRDYPGTYVKAMEEFDAAMIAVFFVALFGGIWATTRADFRRRKRLLAVIEGED